MRLAVLIIGLLLGLVMFIQAFLVTILGSLGENESLSGAGAVGLLVAIFWLIACALVIAFPLASAVIFVLAALMAFGISGDYSDMAIWGTVSLALAGMSFAGWRGKKRATVERVAREHRERERDELLTTLLRQQGPLSIAGGSSLEAAEPLALPATTITCPRCGTSGLSTSIRFCPNCGMQRTVEPTR